ncbi:uncharacterized protein BcabD6B2_11540 [Babesia caballi]|uniref:Uncharacterized protein n=1 Tax=Babesia caballi TaxID=5871 RepID=A0AAV4LP81_BABCB|nr:hypothetical protein BcabD6B2_11540 [Babesia caballi]
MSRRPAGGTSSEAASLTRWMNAHPTGEHGLEQGLVLVEAEPNDLASGLHVNANERVRRIEAIKRKDGHLHSHVVNVHELDVVDPRRSTHHHTGGLVNEVDVQSLGDEGESARSAQVALDDLDFVVLAEVLHVEGATDVQVARQLLRDLLHAPVGAHEDVLSGQNEGGVAGVGPGVLHVLADGVVEDDALRGDAVDLDLLGVLDELGNHDRVLAVDHRGGLQKSLEVLEGDDDAHGGAGQDVRGPHEHGEGRLHAELLSSLQRGEFLPGGLVDAQDVAHLRELVAVLAAVDGLDAGAEDGEAQAVQLAGEVVGSLAAHGNDDALGSLELINGVNHLSRELLEVQTVADVVVSGDSLGVAVDNDGGVAETAQRLDAADGGPVELDAGADAVRAAAEDDDGRGGGDMGGSGAGGGSAAAYGVARRHVVLDTVVGHVAVVGLRGVLGGQGVDDLGDGEHAERLAVLAHGVLSGSRVADAVGNVPVAEAVNFVAEHLVASEVSDARDLGQMRAEDVQRLLHGLLEGAPNRHHLAHGFHAAAQQGVGVLELLEVPLGNLDHHVVEAGLEAGRGDERDGVAHLDEVEAECNASGDVGQGVASRLRGEGGAAAEARVQLDDEVLVAGGVHGELHVALADDAEVANDLEGDLAVLVELHVGQGLGGSDDDGVAGVDAEGVEVLHAGRGDAVVVVVADDLKLNFLPAVESLVDVDADVGRGGWMGVRGVGGQLGVAGGGEAVAVGAGSEDVGQNGAHLGLVLGETRSEAAKGEVGAHQNGVAEFGGGGKAGLDAGPHPGGGAAFANLGHLLIEDGAVLGVDDGLDGRAEHGAVVLGQHARLEQLDAAVQGGLAAEAAHYSVRALLGDDLGDELEGNGLEVNDVGEAVAGLHSGHVGVHQDDLGAGLLQGLDRLAAAVVELARLADGNSAAAQQQNALPLDVLRNPPNVQGDGLVAAEAVDEVEQQKPGVGRAAAGLGVELEAEPGVDHVDYALDAAVVGVDEQGGPVGGQALLVDGEAVVLRGHVALGRAQVHARLVEAAVAVAHLVGARARRDAHQLVAEADAEDGHGALHRLSQVRDRGVGLVRVTRAVGYDQAVVGDAGEVEVVRHQQKAYLRRAEAQHQAHDVALNAAVDHNH